jgi:hypothetical protein
LVKEKMRRDTEIHVVKGEEVARRQLSQWQCKVQFGVPSYWKVIAPHRHLPAMVFKSRALPAAMEVATLPLAVSGVNGSGSTIASLWQLNGRHIFRAYRHRDTKATVAATGGTAFLVVGPSGVGKDSLP